MPGIVRKGLDVHVGHASGTPNPFHQTRYAVGSPNVFVNGAEAVRIGDTTSCGDPADKGSPNVYVNGIQVHRLGDATGGHGSWVPNASASSSTNVFANDGVGVAFEGEPVSIAGNNDCTFYDWENGVCLDQSTNPSAPYYVEP